MRNNNVKCPLCGESYYQHLYSTSTLMHWTPVYKDGVLINRNPNKRTDYCHCLNCGKDFLHTDQNLPCALTVKSLYFTLRTDDKIK